MVERRRPVAGTRPGVTPWTSTSSRPARAREQLELAGGEAGGPEVELALLARRVRAPSPRSWSTPVAGSNSSPVLEVADREDGRERAHREARRPGGRRRRSGRRPRSRRARRAARSRPGTGRSRRRTRRRRSRSRTSSSSNVAGELVGGRGVAGERDELRRLWSTPTTSMPAPGQRERVTPRPAADVEHPHPRLERERVDEEVDLLLGPLGERVPQVRRPEELGDRVEPVRILDGWHAGHTERLRNTLGESTESADLAAGLSLQCTQDQVEERGRSSLPTCAGSHDSRLPVPVAERPRSSRP